METTIKSNQTKTSVRSKKETTSSTSEFWKSVEFNRFGIIPILLVIIACTGGFATAFGAHSDTLRLAIVVFPTMISLALMLAVAPMKAILYVSSIAIILDLLILIF